MNVIRLKDGEYEMKGDVAFHDGARFTGVTYDLFDNGQTAQEITLVDGLPEGFWREWFESGQLALESECKGGVKHGKTTAWYPDGKIKSAGSYEYGIEVEFREWDGRGRLVVERKLGPDTPGANYSLLLKFRKRHANQ